MDERYIQKLLDQIKVLEKFKTIKVDYQKELSGKNL